MDKFDNQQFVRSPIKLIISLYLIAATICAIYTVILAWPITGTEFGRPSFPMEYRFFLMVSCCGFIGGNLHAMSSLTGYIGIQRLQKSWLYWYIIRGVLGAVYAFLIYISIRAVLFSPGIDLRYLNISGLCAFSILVGLFSEIASEKLKAAVNALLGHKPELEKQLDRIGTTIGSTLLDNFRGHIFAEVRNSKGDLALIGEPGEYVMELWFEGTYEMFPTLLNDKRIPNALIDISDGNDVDIVEFKITPKSDFIKFSPGFINTRTKVSGDAKRYHFSFVIPSALYLSETWIEVTQKNRLVAAFSINGIEQSQ